VTYYRSFSTVISGSVSYPASEKGGTVSWSETVNVNIAIVDDPFQGEVKSLGHHVDAVTGSVVATEAAQIASKQASAAEVGAALTTGFRRLVSSEIEQQMVELSTVMAARLAELQAFSERCDALRAQMLLDFKRIQARYTKLFSDLDAELRLRVRRLDDVAFALQDETSARVPLGERARPALQSTVGAQEEAASRAALVGHTFRVRARDLIGSARRLIAAGDALRGGIGESVRAGARPEGRVTVAVPVLVAETDAGAAARRVELPPALAATTAAPAIRQAADRLLDAAGTWTAPAPADWTAIRARAEDRLAAAGLSERQLRVARTLLAAQSVTAPAGGPA